MRPFTLAMLVVLAIAGCGGGDDEPRATTTTAPGLLPRITLAGFTVDSTHVNRSLQQVVLLPQVGPEKRPVLVLLHGAGSDPRMFLDRSLVSALRRLRERAPLVVLADGGGTSYFHDRESGRWGSYVLEEVIPQAIELFGADPDRVAIGGISMGGFGALHLARVARDRFCAVGGHSPAIFRSSLEAPSVAFDNTADFDRHDLLRLVGDASQPPYGDARVWIDVGRADPFVAAATTLAAKLRARGQDVALHVWPGGHEYRYWVTHMRDYVRFYADALEDC